MIKTHNKYLLYFLKDHTQSNTDIKEKYKVKKQSCLNLGNLQQTIHNYKVKSNQMINHQNKKPASLQISQDDSNPSNARHTLDKLRNKRNIIAPEYMRRQTY